MVKIGFDSDIYMERQAHYIEKRIAEFGGKLYLEFGGKLFDDFHASRVLPGFRPDTKMQMIKKIGNMAEIVIVISAADIEKNRTRSDIGITYDQDVLRLIDAFRELEIFVGSVVISQFRGQESSEIFKNKLEILGIKVFMHYQIDGYPSNIPHIVSEDGYGKNEYIETTKPLVIVTAPGPGSGKMATCLSQLYHEHKRGIMAGYVKYETFPVWNLPLKHPVNLAYEAATADLSDVNMIDPYHLEAYDTVAVNYNRDVEVFPVLSAMFDRIMDVNPYKSPTDMGVNMVGYGIIDDDIVCDAAKNEIIRRYYAALCDLKRGECSTECVEKIELIMKKAQITASERIVCNIALAKSEETDGPVMAIQLDDGSVITGKTSPLLGSSSAALLNCVKHFANVPKDTLLISPEVIEPIQKLKIGTLGNRNPRLHADETLIALAISASIDRNAAMAMEYLGKLKGAEAHSTVMLAQVDVDIYRKLGINLTCEPTYQTKKLYHK